MILYLDVKYLSLPSAIAIGIHLNIGPIIDR